MRGESTDNGMLAGSLWRAIPAFALPVAATSILEQLSNLIGTIVIGQLPGRAGTIGMAAVGSNAPITSLLLNLFIGLSLGTNVVIANAMGRGDEETVSRAVHNSVLLSLLGLPATALSELAAEPLLHVLDVPDSTFAEALLYMRVYLPGLTPILLYNFEAAIFRGIGVTRMPLMALVTSTLVNLVLDLALVIGMGLGVAGVALATVVSYSASALILLVALLRHDGVVRLTPSRLRPDGPVIARIVRIGLPAGIQSGVFSVANIIIQGAINGLGTVAMAASSASVSIEYVCYNLLNSFSQACTTFVGQNYGARQIGRCKRTLVVCLVEDGLVCLVAVTCLLVFGHTILACFASEAEVIRIGYIRFYFIFPSYAFCLLYENISGYLRGYGISMAPALLTTLGVCGIRLVWVFLVFPAFPDYTVLMAVYPISLCATMLLVLGALSLIRPARTLGGEG